jgi:hypothetical protein
MGLLVIQKRKEEKEKKHKKEDRLGGND